MSKITFPVRPDTTSTGSYLGFIRDDEHGTIYVGEGSWGATPRPNDNDKPWTLISGSFNQIKWVHVIPESSGDTARMKIFTVISSGIDETGARKYYHTDVEPLSEDNLFSIPGNLNLHFPDVEKEFVSYPFQESNHTLSGHEE